MKSFAVTHNFLGPVRAFAALALLVAGAASAAVFPPAGTCAMLYNAPVPLGKTIPATSPSTILAELTLTTTSPTSSSVAANIVNVKVVYDVATTTAVAQPPASQVGSIVWSTAGSPFTAASLKAGVLTLGVNTFNVYSINNNNTLLVQGVSIPGSGVCQH
jgi:hypothetical protein